MTIEHARARALPKPWGILDLRPWSNARHEGGLIGEIWYERRETTDTSLLIKILFTNQPLSIQVHPDDAFAHSIGLPSGKTEAWYILSATPDAKVALGLNQRLTAQQLRKAVDDGSISDLVVWQDVSPGDVIFVPAGTIHAIGAGLVIAEIHSAATRRFVCSISVGSAIFISRMQSQWRTPGRRISTCNQINSPPNGRSSFPIHTLFSNVSSWRRTLRGPWQRK
jgi:mannose-6-phosphate isomerase